MTTRMESLGTFGFSSCCAASGAAASRQARAILGNMDPPTAGDPTIARAAADYGPGRQRTISSARQRAPGACTTDPTAPGPPAPGPPAPGPPGTRFAPETARHVDAAPRRDAGGRAAGPPSGSPP